MGRGAQVDLRFSLSGDPEIEKAYRTHFVSPTLSQRKLELKEKSDSAPRPVVFEILRDSECTECGVELPRGSMLFMDAEQPLCLACAGMGDLEYLPSGDTALTRRATKYSGTSAVVVRFSRSRGRYERQGILVEPPPSREPRPSALWMPTTGRRHGPARPSFARSRTRNWWSR